MNNRILKTLLCFTLIAAVFFSYTVFPVSPNSVYGASVNGNLSNTIFLDGEAITFSLSSDGELQHVVATNSDPSAFYIDGAKISSITDYAIYAGSYDTYQTYPTIVINEGVEVDTIYGSGYSSNGSDNADTGAITIMLDGGTVGNIYGISNTLAASESALWIYLFGGEIKGSVLAVEPSDTSVDFTPLNYLFEIAISSTLTLSGANSVLGSPEYPLSDVYTEASDENSVYVNVTNSSRSIGDVVAYVDGEVGRYLEEIIGVFASDYYEFELSEVMVTMYDDDLVEYQGVGYYEVTISSLIVQQPEPEDESEEIDRDPLSKEFTAGGAEEADTEAQLAADEAAAAEEEVLNEHDNISKDENGNYVVDGKYDSGTFDNIEDAQKTAESNASKMDGETDVSKFYGETFSGVIEDDGYATTLYEQLVAGIEESGDGYTLDGEQYQTLEEAVSAASSQAKEESYERAALQIATKIASAAHYCDDAETQQLYSSGSSKIASLGYSNADKLAALYAEVMDTISVSQSIINTASAIRDAYNILMESGILTSADEIKLEEFYQSILEMLENAITNSEVEAISNYFEEFILSLEVTKISLADENGNTLAVISQPDGMSSESQISLLEIASTAEYEKLLEEIIQSGDINSDNILTAILGASNVLEDMQVLGVYDISIDGDTPAENGKYTVKVIAPDGMEGIGTVKILHITENGVELITATLSGGYLIFETTSFSEFVILGSEATSLWFAIIPISILALLTAAYIYLYKKEKKGESENGGK